MSPPGDGERPVRVLAVHDYYRERGGEDEAFEREAALLEARGHEVIRFTVRNDDIGDGARIGLATNTIWNRAMQREIGRLVDRERPAIVHFHNFLPLISPAAHRAAAARGAAVVQTLHNFRLLCPGATFFRDGHVCEDCMGRAVQWPAVRHRCYRGSAAASAAVAAMNLTHRVAGTWTRHVDALIALSRFSHARFVAGGLPERLLHVKPNFLPAASASPAAFRADGERTALFVGRLSPEKGVRLLMDAWRGLGGRRLRVIGSGPLEDSLRDRPPAGVQLLGHRPTEEVLAAMREAAFLVFPSECYENMSQVLVEALSAGLPVIAARHGGIPEIVEDGVNGLLFEAGNAEDLRRTLVRAFAPEIDLAPLAAAARRRFEALYGEDTNYARLAAIYEAAQRNAASRKGGLPPAAANPASDRG